MPVPRASMVDLGAAVESLHRAHVLLRLAGPLPAPEPRSGQLNWMNWLRSEQAAREGGLVATTHRRAIAGSYREIALGAQPTPELGDPIDSKAIVRWLLSARHPRPLARWCESVIAGTNGADGTESPVSASVATAVAMAAFHFPRHEALSVWYYLRWRAAWQTEVWPCPRRFLIASGGLLPALRRRLLRHPNQPIIPGNEPETQAALL